MLNWQEYAAMKKILVVGLGAVAALALWFAPQVPEPLLSSALAQSSESGPCVDSNRLVLSLGIDDSEETDWSGTASGWVRDERASWSAESQSAPLKLAGGGQAQRVLPASVDVNLPTSPCGSAADPSRSVRVETREGSFDVAVGGLAMGRRVSLLGGRVEAALAPAASPVRSTAIEEDFPSCASMPDHSVLCAYVEYEPGEPIDEEKALAGEFDSIEFRGNGDRVALLHRDSAGWRDPAYVTASGRDVWQPVVMSLPDGGAAVLWSEQREGNWDIYSRTYSLHSGDLGPERRHTTDPGSDFNVVASQGYFAWQGRRNDQFDIFVSPFDGPAVRVSTSAANDWRPSIATDSGGTSWVAWDTYDAGNYDVYLRRYEGGELDQPIAVAASPRFEARATVAVDSMDRPWVAFEDSDEGWGKDAGDRWTGRQATSMYVNKNILVRVWDGELKQTRLAPEAPTVDYFHDDTRVATSQRHKISIPVMAFDGAGRPWLLFRKHPLQTGRGERWRSYGAFYSQGAWSEPIPLESSDNLLDREPGLVPQPDGSLLAVFAGDRRLQARSRQDSNLSEAKLVASSAAADADLVPADASRPESSRLAVHPDEAQQIAQIRSRRVQLDGKSLQFLRGEFHRHTEFSSHRDWDGPFEEVWRYGLDVAGMDWIGAGDHDYAVGQDYMWWLQQKAGDIYNAPGSFSAMYSYERSVSYPSGHRNVILPRRGIRPLPRMTGKARVEGTAQDGSPDIHNLFAYLRHFGGICSSHTSGTNMGTDWRDGDIEVEPVVELFQGHRQSYEVSGGPHAATGPEDTIQGYRPAGFLWEAFQKGRRLGFQASSDHVSTHISYAIVLAEEHSRKGIIDAFKRRHSYAAHDNIALVVRSGDHLMGDEFASAALPRLRIIAHGTAPIDSVEVIRQVGSNVPEVVASMEPGRVSVDLDWSDPAAVAGEWNMYYVRLRQRNEAMAWASPLWIRYEP